MSIRIRARTNTQLSWRSTKVVRSFGFSATRFKIFTVQKPKYWQMQVIKYGTPLSKRLFAKSSFILTALILVYVAQNLPLAIFIL